MTRLCELSYVAMVVGTMLWASTPARADNDESRDRRTYERLLREVRTSHAEYEQTLSQAVAEARENEGDAKMGTKAKVLAARDELDRRMIRLSSVALRHGWEVPTIDELKSDTSTHIVRSDREQVFAPVDALVQQRFAQEAQRVAASVKLPVISLITATSDGARG